MARSAHHPVRREELRFDVAALADHFVDWTNPVDRAQLDTFETIASVLLPTLRNG